MTDVTADLPQAFGSDSAAARLLLAIYDAGVRRGSDEATAFEWGESASGKYHDNLIDAIYDHVNEGRPYGQWEPWDTVAAFVKHAVECARLAPPQQPGSDRTSGGIVTE